MAGRSTRSFARGAGPAFMTLSKQHGMTPDEIISYQNYLKKLNAQNQPFGKGHINQVSQSSQQSGAPNGNQFHDNRMNSGNQQYNNRQSFGNSQQNSPDSKTSIKLLQQAQPMHEPEPVAEVEPQGTESMKTEESEGEKRFPWKKGNLNKVKKLSNSERRGRQNKKLRKLLTPKNALMVLNELHGPQVPEYKLGQTLMQPYMGASQYKAEVVINGSTYQGQGLSKILAKNNAAEKAIRDLVLERMRNERNQETLDGDDVVMTDAAAKSAVRESQIPMIHLASYALHKLFTEWQAEGYEIPLLTKNLSTSNTNLTDVKAEGEPAKKTPKAKTELPPNASDLHPAMLLSQMRPGCQYNDVSAEGTAPGNTIFTVGVVVDGQQFLGSAKNKKEARRQAAMQACSTVFGVQYSVAQSGEQQITTVV